MIATITLDYALTSVKQAREFVSDHLEGQDAQLVADTTLMVSELVTNAIRHAGGPCELTLELTAGSVRVDVRDVATTPPQSRSPSPDDAFGRGLLIVSALADDWGIDSTPRRGNTVWFIVQLHNAHGSDRHQATAGHDISAEPLAGAAALDAAGSDDEPVDRRGPAGPQATFKPGAPTTGDSTATHRCRRARRAVRYACPLGSPT